MKQSRLFPKTIKSDPKDAVAVNHKLLVRGGFIDQLMAGSWTLLPLGWRVVSKISQIIREELNETGAQEILMPLMHPKYLWEETGRWDSAREIMYQLNDNRDKEFALAFTHEEIFLDLVRKHLQSHSELPIKLYHFSTKFRQELRASSGIMRGREFLMKDLYSLHVNEENFKEYYGEVKEAYLRIFKRIGLDVIITETGGGIFTKNHTHEFQVLAEAGEDTIYYCSECKLGYNQEIFEGKTEDVCSHCGQGKLIEGHAVEVGNIFEFGTYYCEKMSVHFVDDQGQQKLPFFGSYGIGQTRVMGAIVESFHDEKGIIWPGSVAPFKYHLIGVSGKGSADGVEEIYKKLIDTGQEVLWDDRDISVGQKFADADLIGIPNRLVVSDKTGDKIELKKRTEETGSLISLEELLA